MEWYWILAIMIGGLIAFMLIGMPVAFAFFAVDLIGYYFFARGELGLSQLARNTFDSLQSFELVPIALFILMGEIMFHTGVAARAIDAIDKLIARVPGRLSLVAIVGGTVFSSLSGSTIANTAMLSSTLLPEMYKRGYKPEISIGPIIAVGGIAMLIPPSALAVLLGSVARIPIGPLLIASIVPALILCSLFFLYVIIRCWTKPSIAPAYEVGDLTFWERIKPTLIYVLPLMSIFVVVVGSIIYGIATPTQSAALGAVVTLLAALGYRRLTLKNLMVSIKQTTRLSVMTLFIIAGSLTFSKILALSQASEGFANTIIDADLTPIMIILGMLGILMVLGCFMDQVSMMMITSPIFMPVIERMEGLGFDLTEERTVWFGVLMLMVLEISLATPPFGLLLFVAKGAAPSGTTMAQIIRSVMPFIFLALFVVAILIIWPQLTLWLPSLISN